ncbi:putative calcium-transporting ATPase [Cryptosporidium serpentis]
MYDYFCFIIYQIFPIFSILEYINFLWYYSKIIDERRNQRKLKEMINNIQSSNVYVKREHKKISIDSQDIVPMDVVLLSKGSDIQCDLILVKGYFFVDKSSLTGESIPVLKKPITVNLNSNNINTKIEFCNLIYRDSILLAGTKVIKFYDQDELSKQKEMAECIALNTRAFTYRSEIINSVLIENANEVNFHENPPLLCEILLIINLILIINLL